MFLDAPSPTSAMSRATSSTGPCGASQTDRTHRRRGEGLPLTRRVNALASATCALHGQESHASQARIASPGTSVSDSLSEDADGTDAPARRGKLRRADVRRAVVAHARHATPRIEAGPRRPRHARPLLYRSAQCHRATRRKSPGDGSWLARRERRRDHDSMRPVRCGSERESPLSCGRRDMQPRPGRLPSNGAPALAARRRSCARSSVFSVRSKRQGVAVLELLVARGIPAARSDRPRARGAGAPPCLALLVIAGGTAVDLHRAWRHP